MSFFYRKEPPPLVIVLSVSGIELCTLPESKLVHWESITRIVAFKRDLFSRDLLCLALETDEQNAIELNEGMEGWDKLVQGLEEHLVGAVAFDTWFMAAIAPPFEVSMTEVYRRT